MKKILVIYYSQSGQLTKALKRTLIPLEADPEIQIFYELIKPVEPFPFPWSYYRFFDVFPESVQGIPCKLLPISIDPEEHFDLIILGYQPWFLSPCIPVNSFLLTSEALKLLRDKPVITIIACRNMWLNAQEKMKSNLKMLHAKLVGNISFVDRSYNLVSLITVLAYLLGGVKGKFLGIFPKFGVSDEDMENLAPEFGRIILENLRRNNYNDLQARLNVAGAISLKSQLMMLEGRGKVLFPLYANFIASKGSMGNSNRKMRVRIFGVLLPAAIVILSPIITLVSRIYPFFFKRKLNREIGYYSQNQLREN